MKKIEIYEDGVLRETVEAESYIIVSADEEGIRRMRHMHANLIEGAALYGALRSEALEVGELIGNKFPGGRLALEFLVSAAEEGGSKQERVEMTPEAIEAIINLARGED